MTHNYYLYADPSNGNRITWIPWDNNEALAPGKMGGALSLALSEVNNGWPLIRYIMDQPIYSSQYKILMRKFIDETFIPTVVQAEYLRLTNLVRPFAIGPDGEKAPYTFVNSSAEFEAAFQTLNVHANARSAEVNTFLK